MNLSPNKKLGQHWLHDEDVLEDMCLEAQVSQSDTVLEVGPGLGTLTRHLAQHAGQVIALEFDPRLAENLQQNPIAPNVQVTPGDILKFDLGTLPRDYKVVANLPYYITSKIVRLLLESNNPPQLATILVQKEVAERMAAQPGDMSILAVSVQYYCEVQLGPVVPAHLFTPPPEVDSQIITLTRRTQPLFTDVDTRDFFKVVRAGFGEKRKKLRNSLHGGLRLDKDLIEEILKQTSLPENARAEELSLADWHNLTKLIGESA